MRATNYEVDWERLLSLRVSWKLAELCNRLGEIRIKVYDHQHREQKCLPSSPEGLCTICQEIPELKTLCLQNRNLAIQQAFEKKQTIQYQCPAELTSLVIPMDMEGHLLGYLVSSGVLISSYTPAAVGSEKPPLYRFLSDSLALKKIYEKVPCMSQEQLALFQGLLEGMVEEILSFQREWRDRQARVNHTGKGLSQRYDFSAIIGESPAIQQVCEVLEKVIHTEATILLQGESGTGKELIARVIHYNSARKDRPFVAENCSALSADLLETELFGHEKGAFTGAVHARAGLFEMAGGGTLLLDEISDISPDFQVKLLRVLEEKAIRRVGGTRFKEIDVRIIVTSNQDLRQLVEEKRFRPDLYHRLNEITITLPPLRERRQDIPLLIQYFLKQYCQEKQITLKTLEDEVFEILLGYSWPGNVRELKNVIHRIILLSGTRRYISKDLLPPYIIEATGTAPLLKRQPGKPIKEMVEDLERSVIYEGLKKTKGNRSQLARDLGLSRKGLLFKIKRYGLGG